MLSDEERKSLNKLLEANTELLDLLYSMYVVSDIRDDEVKERVEKMLVQEGYFEEGEINHG
jgi:hypothetical protein